MQLNLFETTAAENPMKAKLDEIVRLTTNCEIEEIGRVRVFSTKRSCANCFYSCKNEWDDLGFDLFDGFCAYWSR